MSDGRVIIENFGPIVKADISMNKSFQVIIGAQASGKSTVCCVLYFCTKIKDYMVDFSIDPSNFSDEHSANIFVNFLKFLTGRFMGCFGTPTFQGQLNSFEHLYGRIIASGVAPNIHATPKYVNTSCLFRKRQGNLKIKTMEFTEKDLELKLVR